MLLMKKTQGAAAASSKNRDSLNLDDDWVLAEAGKAYCDIFNSMHEALVITIRSSLVVIGIAYNPSWVYFSRLGTHMHMYMYMLVNCFGLLHDSSRQDYSLLNAEPPLSVREHALGYRLPRALL